MLQCKWSPHSNFIVFKRTRYSEIYKQNLPAQSEFPMTDTGYINKGILLEWLKRRKGKSKVVPVL